MPRVEIDDLPQEARVWADEIASRRLARMQEVLSARLQSIVVVAEAVRRRHNVSAILRSAEAFGVQDVHLISNAFQPAPGAARGTERWIQINRHDTTTGCLELLKGQGFRIFVCDLDEHAYAPESVPVDAPVALVFGSELQGVSKEARELADGVVQVPMRGFAESLNVSVAAALTLRPVCERRRALVGDGDLTVDAQRALLVDWIEREVRAKAHARKRHRM